MSFTNMHEHLATSHGNKSNTAFGHWHHSDHRDQVRQRKYEAEFIHQDNRIRSRYETNTVISSKQFQAVLRFLSPILIGHFGEKVSRL